MLAFALGLSLSPDSRAEGRQEADRERTRDFVATLGLLTQQLSPARPALGMVVVLRGEVGALDFGRGRLTLLASGGTHRLRASPDQLAPLTPGQVVELECGDFGGERWVISRSEEQGLLAGFGNGGRARGALGALDKTRGTVQVAGRTFHAHPLALEGLLPGQQARVDYVNVEGVAWLRAISLEGE